jgi:hypothetical protein
LAWLLLLLIPLIALWGWAGDPFAHDTKVSVDSNRTTDTANAAVASDQASVSDIGEGDHHSYLVSLSDGYGIAAILIRTANIRQEPPEMARVRWNPGDLFVPDETPRWRRIIVLILILLGVSALSLVEPQY